MQDSRRTFCQTPKIRHIALVALAFCAPSLTGCVTPTSGETGAASSAVTVEDAQDAREAGDYETALAMLEQAIRRNPTLTDAHLEMGEILEEQGDYSASEQSYEKAVALEPRDFDAQLGLARVRQTLGKLRESIRPYLQALAIQGENAEANLGLANVYARLGDTRQARDFALAAVEAAPDDGDARAQLAAIHAKLGEHALAIRQYEAALELTEITPELLLALAESLGETQRYQEMVNTLQSLLAMEESAAARERLGFALFKLRDYSGARAAFRRAVELDSAHFPALNGLGVTLLNDYLLGGSTDLAAKDEAMSLLRRSLMLNENQPQVRGLVKRFG